MKTYNVMIEQAEDGWLAAHALEDDSIHTQARTIDEVVRNIREVVQLLTNESEVSIELIVPAQVNVS